MDFIKQLNGRKYDYGMASIELANEDNFNDFQLGFKDSETWQDSWYVIAKVAMTDGPYFIDTNNGKVYWVPHDLNYNETAELISGSIDSFLKIMELIDSNLKGVSQDNTDLEERILLANSTIEQITEIDEFVNQNHFKTNFYFFLNID